jgi:hypothetical protein
MTTSSNLQQHLESIPLSSMPATFRDAVLVSRELNVKYLWIDSLCIIQDSAEDCNRECFKMAQIYQNSTVTISGASAFDSIIAMRVFCTHACLHNPLLKFGSIKTLRTES